MPFCPLGLPGEVRRRLVADPVLAAAAIRLTRRFPITREPSAGQLELRGGRCERSLPRQDN